MSRDIERSVQPRGLRMGNAWHVCLKSKGMSIEWQWGSVIFAATRGINEYNPNVYGRPR